MKKIYYLFLIFLGTVSSYSQFIPFTGTGALTSNGWIESSTTATAGTLNIMATASDSGNSLSYTGLVASTGNRTTTVHQNSQDANYPVTALTGTAYFSTLIKATNNTGMNPFSSSGDYLMTFGANSSTGPSPFVGRLFVKQGSAVNTFAIGILNTSGGATPVPTYSSVDYSTNQTYFIVVKYVFATNTASLYVNATPGLLEPTATVTNAAGTTAGPAQIGSICIRQGGSTTTNTTTGNVEIDEIRVGATWSAVTPPSTVLGVNQNEIEGLKVYPNPVTNGALYITSVNDTAKEVSLFDLLGKQVVKTTVTDQAINVANLKGGVYLVKINTEGKTATRKLVIR